MENKMFQRLLMCVIAVLAFLILMRNIKVEGDKERFTNDTLGELVLKDIFGTTPPITPDMVNDFYDWDALWEFNQTRSVEHRLEQILKVMKRQLYSSEKWQEEYNLSKGEKEEYKLQLEKAIDILEDGSIDEGDLNLLDRNLGCDGIWRKLLKTDFSSAGSPEKVYSLYFEDKDGEAFYIPSNTSFTDMCNIWLDNMYAYPENTIEEDMPSLTLSILTNEKGVIQKTLKGKKTKDVALALEKELNKEYSSIGDGLRCGLEKGVEWYWWSSLIDSYLVDENVKWAMIEYIYSIGHEENIGGGWFWLKDYPEQNDKYLIYHPIEYKIKFVNSKSIPSITQEHKEEFINALYKRGMYPPNTSRQ